VDASDYRLPCHAVPDVFLAPLDGPSIARQLKYPVTLLYVACANTSNHGGFTGSMQRTRNRKAVRDYEFFKETIKAAVGAAVDSAIVHGIQILLLARIGCKIYAGPHEERINHDIMTLIREVLREKPLQVPALSPLSPTAPLQMDLPRFSYFAHIEVVSKGV
jgi:hypothetical protein